MPLKGHKTQVSLILACEWLQELLCPGRQNQRWILRDLRACGEELARTLPIVTWSWLLSLPSCPSCILEEKMVGTNVHVTAHQELRFSNLCRKTNQTQAELDVVAHTYFLGGRGRDRVQG